MHSSTALCFWLSTVTRFSHVIFSKSHKCQFPSEYSVLTNQSILLLLCFSSAPSLLSSHKAMSILSVAACLSIDVCYLNECESIFFYSFALLWDLLFKGVYFSILILLDIVSHSLTQSLSLSIFPTLSLSFFLYFYFGSIFSVFFPMCSIHIPTYTFFISCTTFSYFLFIGDHNIYFQNTSRATETKTTQNNIQIRS